MAVPSHVHPSLLSKAGQGCGVLDAAGTADGEVCGTAGSIPGPAQLLPWQEPFRFLSDLSQCCFPSAVLFQHLIIYCRLCGQLYRGSYCLIELLDSSAAKIITRVKKMIPPPRAACGAEGKHPPWGPRASSGGDLGCSLPSPPACSPSHPEDCNTQPQG